MQEDNKRLRVSAEREDDGDDDDLTRSTSSATAANENILPALLQSDHHTLLEMRKQELEYAPNAEYFSQQPNIKPTMRAKLVDWIFDLGVDFHLRRYSTYCGVNFLDRFLSVAMVERSSLQLVGLVALWTGTKIEERYPPLATELCKNTGVTEKDMVVMEATMLDMLQWSAMPPTAYSFANFYLQRLHRIRGAAVPLSPQHLGDLMELLDFASLDSASLMFQPSILAAAALLVLRERFEVPTEQIEAVTALEIASMQRCVDWLRKLIVLGFTFSRDTQPSNEQGGDAQVQSRTNAALELILNQAEGDVGPLEHWKTWREMTRYWGEYAEEENVDEVEEEHIKGENEGDNSRVSLDSNVDNISPSNESSRGAVWY